MRKLLLIVANAAFVLNGGAATTYRVTFSSTGSLQMFHSARVTTVKTRLRADLERLPDAPGIYDYVVSSDGGETLIAVNRSLRTWFPLDVSPFVVHSHLLDAMPPRETAKNISWSVKKNSEKVIAAGGPTYVGVLSYVVEYISQGMTVRRRCKAVEEVWPTRQDITVKWPARAPLLTGIPSVDAKITGSSELLEAFPDRIVVTVTRQYEGGTPSSEVHSIMVDDIRQVADPDAGVFVRPPDYREQQPVVGAPGQASM